MLVIEDMSVGCCRDGMPTADCPDQMSGLTDWLLEKLYPEKPLPYLAAGAIVIAASNLETFENSPARTIMVLLGGSALAVGGLPILVKMFKGEKIIW